MVFYDFLYDGFMLSDFGFIVCEFDGSGGVETISNGCQLTFNTVAVQNGSKHFLTSETYDNRLETTFQICKNPCEWPTKYVDDNGNEYGNPYEITIEEYRQLVQWLCRKNFHKFKVVHDDMVSIYYNGTFNVNKIEVDGTLYGLELQMITDRPYALEELHEVIIDSEAQVANMFMIETDEEGSFYPNMQFQILANGDLTIDFNEKTTVVKGCKSGEIITFEYPIVETSNDVHKNTLMNDFNWVFPRLNNSFDNHRNEFTTSLPCQVTIRYSPVAKVQL